MSRRLLIFVVMSFLLFSFTVSAFALSAENIIKLNTDIEISKDEAVDNVVSIGGNITVFGRVKSSVVAVGGSIILKEGSSVDGEVVSVGGDIIRDPAARIGGKITQVYMPHFIPSFTSFLKGGWLVLWATISVLVLLGFLGLAILISALIPEHMGTAVSVLEKSFVAMLLWGILWMILIVPVAVLLAISIIGIVLIPLEMLLVALGLILGYIASAIFIGKNILLSFKKKPVPFLDAIIGILTLFLIGFVPVVGPVVKALFLVAGFGAVLTTRFGTIK